MNYKELFIDIDNFDPNNMEYTKPIALYKETKNIGIYYNEPFESIESDNSSESSELDDSDDSSESSESSDSIDSYSSDDNHKKPRKKPVVSTSKKTPAIHASPSKSTSKPKQKPKPKDKVIKKTHQKKKIIVKTPKMSVPFDIKEFDNNGKKSYSMSISFNPLTQLYNEEEIKKFHLFVKKLDTAIEKLMLDSFKKWRLPTNLKYRPTLQKISNDFPPHINLNLPRDNKGKFLFDIYDNDGNKSSLDIITKKTIVCVVMELTDIKFTEKDFRLGWTILQIRTFRPQSPIQDFFMSGCFIGDDDDPQDTIYSKLIDKYNSIKATPLNIPSIPYFNPHFNSQPNYMPMTISGPAYNCPPGYNFQQNIPPPPPMGLAPPLPVITKKEIDNSNSYKPSLKELLDAKKSLKKVADKKSTETDSDSVSESKRKPIVSESKRKSITSESKAKSKSIVSESKPKSITSESKPKSITSESKSKSITSESKPKSITSESKSKSITSESKPKSITSESKSKPNNRIAIKNEKLLRQLRELYVMEKEYEKNFGKKN